MSTEETEDWHGTLNGYSNRLCRCTGCKAAWAAYVRKSKERRVLNIPEHVHGTENGYGNYKCRCEDCTIAWRNGTRDRARRRRENATAG